MADEDVQYVINFDNYDAVLLPGNVADAIVCILGLLERQRQRRLLSRPRVA